MIFYDVLWFFTVFESDISPYLRRRGDLQWSVLVAATLAISAFVMVDSGSSEGDAGIPLMGVVPWKCYEFIWKNANEMVTKW